jgi:hypothetical protein
MKRISLILMIAAMLGATGICRADTLKAALFEEVPDQRFAGFAVWYTDNGEPAANIQIPDLGMTVELYMRRNGDLVPSANHTIELAFKLSAGFPHGGVANVPGILLKPGETVRGMPLNAVSAKVATNVFLISLSPVDTDMRRNIQLMREHTWFDVPIVYSDGKRALLAVEKGDAMLP